MDDERPVLTQSRPSAWRRVMATLLRPAAIIAIASLLLLGWQWLETRARLAHLEQELATRLGASDTVAKGARVLALENQETLQALDTKLSTIETQLAEAQNQQLALQAMYQELSKTSDERVLAEIEHAVTIAAQQLQIAGNVEAALIALDGADPRLARAGGAQFLSLRKLINRDVERLKALPLADVPGIALKLENVISTIDELPLSFEQRSRMSINSRPDKAALPLSTSFWQRLGQEMWADMKQLVRIERIDQNEPQLLSPSQAFFLRENLKLRLIDARLSLLQRDGRNFHEDLRQAHDWLIRYFDGNSKPVIAAITVINSLMTADLNPDLPSLQDTLAKVRNFKLVRERSGR
jgi:uroporphyrin-3 C-methyltransferase